MVGRVKRDIFNRVVMTLLAVATGMLPLGCRTAKEQRVDADKVAGDIIAQSQAEALGKAEPFTINTAANELRRRLMIGQQLPRTGAASLGVDQLKPIEHWPEDDYLKERAAMRTTPIVTMEQGKPLKLTLVQALQVGARNSRAYQSRKESVFETALALDLERHDFRTSFAGALDTLFNHDVEAVQANLDNSFTASMERRFESGLSLTSRIIFDLAALLTQDRSSSLGFFADISVSLPLLAGSGRHIVREPLTQAERNVLYSLWGFERFKRTFAVDVASDYLAVLQQLDRVKNAEANFQRRLEAYERARALAEAGSGKGFEADQARQRALEGRDALNNARVGYEQRLDEFKITLGLPTDARLELDRDELERLAAGAQEALKRTGAKQTGEDAKGPIAQQTTPGRYELPENLAVDLAFKNRLDLRQRIEEVEDAKRDVVIAADALGAALTFTAGGSIGERRSGAGGAQQSNAQLRFDRSNYNLGLGLDLPWDKVDDRNTYRNRLIDLEQSVRDVQELEDNIKLRIRSALRNLAQQRASIQIQDQALVLAERRVEGTGLLLQAGRVPIRDVLDSQDDLVDAQNELTNALVSYRVAELQLQRDMGVLEVNEKGLWREYRPE